MTYHHHRFSYHFEISHPSKGILLVDTVNLLTVSGCVFESNAVHSMTFSTKHADSILLQNYYGSLVLHNTSFRDEIGLVNKLTMKLFHFNLYKLTSSKRAGIGRPLIAHTSHNNFYNLQIDGCRF